MVGKWNKAFGWRWHVLRAAGQPQRQADSRCSKCGRGRRGSDACRQTDRRRRRRRRPPVARGCCQEKDAFLSSQPWKLGPGCKVGMSCMCYNLSCDAEENDSSCRCSQQCCWSPSALRVAQLRDPTLRQRHAGEQAAVHAGLPAFDNRADAHYRG